MTLDLRALKALDRQERARRLSRTLRRCARRRAHRLATGLPRPRGLGVTGGLIELAVLPRASHFTRRTSFGAAFGAIGRSCAWGACSPRWPSARASSYASSRLDVRELLRGLAALLARHGRDWQRLVRLSDGRRRGAVLGDPYRPVREGARADAAAERRLGRRGPSCRSASSSRRPRRTASWPGSDVERGRLAGDLRAHRRRPTPCGGNTERRRYRRIRRLPP